MTLRWDLNEYSCSDIFNSCIKDSLIVIWTVNRIFITNQPTLALMSQKSKFCFTCSNVSSQFFLESKHLIESDGFHFCISFKERMECDDKKGYVFCAHCNNFISRSTFERHERKRNGKNLTDTFAATSNSRNLFHGISSSSDDEG